MTVMENSNKKPAVMFNRRLNGFVGKFN